MAYQSLLDQKFIEIGKVKRGHGYKGHAKISVDELYEEDLVEQEFLFIEIDGYQVPFKIEEIVLSKDAIVKLQNIDNPEQLNRYHNRSISLLKKDIVHAKDELDQYETYSSFTGLDVYDEKLGFIGQIDRIEEYPQQLIAIIIIEGKEIMIPLHPDLVKELDFDSKKVVMTLPEGLF